MNSNKDTWFVIINPVANDWKALAKWDSIKAELEANGFLFHFRMTEKKRDATNFVLTAVKEGFRYFMSVGGDGTMNETINGIMKQEYCDPLEILFTHIPVGSMDDWARMFKIPRDHKIWISTMLQGRVVTQDVGLVEYDFMGIAHSWYFANLAGIGYSGTIAKIVNDNESSIIAKSKLARLIALSVFTYKPLKMKIIHDSGKVFDGEFLGVNVGIGRKKGHIKLTPHAIYNDGLLAYSHDNGFSSRVDFLRIVRKVLSAGDFSDKAVTFGKLKKISIEPKPGEEIFLQADGEFLGLAPCTFTVKPGALNVLVPQKKK